MVDKKKYIESQSRATGVVTSDDLMCKTCKHRNDSMPTAHCDIYKDVYKPDAVLLGRECMRYREAE